MKCPSLGHHTAVVIITWLGWWWWCSFRYTWWWWWWSRDFHCLLPLSRLMKLVNNFQLGNGCFYYLCRFLSHYDMCSINAMARVGCYLMLMLLFVCWIVVVAVAQRGEMIDVWILICLMLMLNRLVGSQQNVFECLRNLDNLTTYLRFTTLYALISTRNQELFTFQPETLELL